LAANLGLGDAAGRLKLHLRFSLGLGLEASVVVVPGSGSVSTSRLVGQDEQALAGAFMWEYAMALLMRKSWPPFNEDRWSNQTKDRSSRLASAQWLEDGEG
jgi:hypothetical protein